MYLFAYPGINSSFTYVRKTENVLTNPKPDFLKPWLRNVHCNRSLSTTSPRRYAPHERKKICIPKRTGETDAAGCPPLPALRVEGQLTSGPLNPLAANYVCDAAHTVSLRPRLSLGMLAS